MPRYWRAASRRVPPELLGQRTTLDGATKPVIIETSGRLGAPKTSACRGFCFPLLARGPARGDQVVRTVAAAVPGAPYNWVKPTFGWPGT